VDLTNAGFNVQFVGQNSGVSDGAPANSWPDEAYEGGPLGGIPDGDGWTTSDGILDAPNAAALAPQILLLDLGANDIIGGSSPGQIQTNLQTLVETFAADDPGVIILLAVPTGFPPDPSSPIQVQRQQKANQSRMSGVAGKVASTERKAGINIVRVNLFGGYNLRTDTKDGTHPNIQGEQLIARKYFSALRPIIRKMIKNGA
jgi:lysophospholipase L1-like esterase